MNSGIDGARLFPGLALLCLFAFSASALAGGWATLAADQIIANRKAGSILVIGELHGTVEAPHLIAVIAAKLAGSGRVMLGLEIPRQEQRRIDTFLASSGDGRAVKSLMAGEFWKLEPDRSDGRRSQAMLTLLQSIRAQRESGSAIEISALDDTTFLSQGLDRRAGIASRISALHAGTDDVVLVLIGNYHARMAPPERAISEGKPLSEAPVPTAAMISVPVTSVNVTACSGTFWACSDGKCGPLELPARCDGASFPIFKQLDPVKDGYHFAVELERLSVSPPAK